MKAIIENGGMSIFQNRISHIALFKDFLFFNQILNTINNASNRDELNQQMVILIGKARLNNERTQFTFGFDSEFTYMEVFQDGNSLRLIFVDFEN